jgi:hypothetical protein
VQAWELRCVVSQVGECCWRFVAEGEASKHAQQGYDGNASSTTLGAATEQKNQHR